MSKILPFIRLDFITVKPYLTLKNLMIYILLSIVMFVTVGGTATGIGVMMAFSTIYVGYPFAIGDKTGIDILYAALSIKRNTVVLGRYMSALLAAAASGVLAYAVTFTVYFVTGTEFAAAAVLAETLALFMVYGTVLAIQLPFYFKLGYARAKAMASLPFICIPVVVLVSVSLMRNSALAGQIGAFLTAVAANPALLISACAALWLGILAVSYRVSLGFYLKRDF